MKNPYMSKMYRYNKVKKKDNPETRLVLDVIKYLRFRGLIAGKVKTMGVVRNGRYTLDMYLMKGLPDIFAFDVGNNVMYGLECKVTTEQTENQLSFQKLFHNPPSRVYAVIRSVEDMQNLLKVY